MYRYGDRKRYMYGSQRGKKRKEKDQDRGEAVSLIQYNSSVV